MKLSDALNLPDLQNYRNEHLESSPLESCQVCTRRSEIGARTLRSYHNDLSLPESAAQFQSHISASQIFSLDINLSNVCNLKCRMCSFTRSTGWREDQATLARSLPYIEKPVLHEKSMLELDFEKFDNLKYVTLKGGEPLYDRQSLALMQKLIDTGLAKKIILTIFTNGVFVKKHIELLKQFKIINLNFSFEGTGSLYSYIRGGQHGFEEFTENVLVAAEQKNILTGFMYTPQAYNIFDFTNAVDFVWNQINPRLTYQLTVNNLKTIFGNVLLEPSYLAVPVLPLQLRQRVRVQIQDSDLCKLPVWSALESLLLQPQQSPEFERFMQFTKTLDDVRGQSLTEVVPQFAEVFA